MGVFDRLAGRGRGGSGLRVVRVFSGASFAAARTVRDTYYTANPDDLAALNANTICLFG